MKAAIAVLAASTGRKVFVLGDMGELGGEAAALHAEVGRVRAREPASMHLLALGEASRQAVQRLRRGRRSTSTSVERSCAARARRGPARAPPSS